MKHRLLPLVVVACIVGWPHAPGAQPPTVHFSDGMEGDVSGWIAQGPWAVSSERVHGGSFAWNDSPGGFYANHRFIYLYTPRIDLTSAVNPFLTFWQYRRLFPDDDPFTRDFTQVGISLNDGASIHQILETRSDPTPFDGSFVQSTFDLSAYAGWASTLRIYFLFVSGPTGQFDGWIIDDVEVKEAPAPAAFTKIAPGDGALVSSPTISWAASSGAASYEYCVDTTNNNTCDGSWTSTTATSATPSGLAGSTPYWWQVRAVNPAGKTEANGGTWWTFTIGQPGPFSKTSPGNGAMGQPVDLNLTWASSTGATSYEFCIDTINNNACDAAWTSTGSSTGAGVGGLAEVTTYWWHVRAQSAGGTTEANSGAWWSFTTGSLPGAFSKLKGSTRAIPTLVWETSAGATSYEYCFENCHIPAYWTSTSNTSVNIGPRDPAHYRWQVRALNNIGTTEANGGTRWRFHNETVNDFDGDGKADITVYRPSTGAWYYLNSGTGNTSYTGHVLGMSGDTLVPGDLDFVRTESPHTRDGKTDPAVYRPSTGQWLRLESNNGYGLATNSWGLSTDAPVQSDFDADHRNDPAVFRPSTGGWHILRSVHTYTDSFSVSWGLSTDVPMPGDYDGDALADPAVFRPSTGGWHILHSSTNYGTSTSVTLGVSGDLPVHGDYDGDGRTDIAVFRPSTGAWIVLKSITNFTSGFTVSWGLSTDVPVPGDFDGDGKLDIGVFRASTGFWYILTSSNNFASYLVVSWGLSTDVPIGRRPQ